MLHPTTPLTAYLAPFGHRKSAEDGTIRERSRPRNVESLPRVSGRQRYLCHVAPRPQMELIDQSEDNIEKTKIAVKVYLVAWCIDTTM